MQVTPGGILLRLRAAIAALALLALAGVARAAAVPVPPHLSARSWLVQDLRTGRVIARSRAGREMEPGSLAKLMTLYVVLRHVRSGTLGLHSRVRISREVWRMHGSQMFLKAGSRVPVIQLIRGMIVDGANDAAVALADGVSGSQQAFVDRMNRQARVLGMGHTHYVNASGLPAAGMRTTASDTAVLARALIRRFPKFYHFFGRRSFRFDDITQHNRNRLLWRDHHVDGLITGDDGPGRYHLVASSRRDGERMIAVVLGTPRAGDRFDDARSLLHYAFHYYRTRRLYRPGKPVARKKVWEGAGRSVAVAVPRPVWVTYPRGDYRQLRVALKLPRDVIAPVDKGERLGKLSVSLDNDTLARVPVVAAGRVPEGDLWRRWHDAAWLAVTRHLREWFPKLTRAIASN